MYARSFVLSIDIGAVILRHRTALYPVDCSERSGSSRRKTIAAFDDVSGVSPKLRVGQRRRIEQLVAAEPA